MIIPVISRNMALVFTAVRFWLKIFEHSKGSKGNFIEIRMQLKCTWKWSYKSYRYSHHLCHSTGCSTHLVFTSVITKLNYAKWTEIVVLDHFCCNSISFTLVTWSTWHCHVTLMWHSKMKFWKFWTFGYIKPC